MNKEMLRKKLYNVNEWCVKAREMKDWETYRQATIEYNRLLNILKEMEV